MCVCIQYARVPGVYKGVERHEVGEVRRTLKMRLYLSYNVVKKSNRSLDILP